MFVFCLGPLLVLINDSKQNDEFGRYSIMNIPKKIWKKFVLKRRTTLMRLKTETNNPLANKPPVTEYYDTTAKISVEKDEEFEMREVYNDGL
jgi:hypothetical protein